MLNMLNFEGVIDVSLHEFPEQNRSQTVLEPNELHAACYVAKSA